MPDWQLRTTDGRMVVESLEIAATWWTRFAGMQLRRPLPPRHALLIAPCPSIHTCFVRSSLDVWFLDRSGRVVEIRSGLLPWRIAIPNVAVYAVLEASPGWLNLNLGETIRVVSQTNDTAPPPLADFRA